MRTTEPCATTHTPPSLLAFIPTAAMIFSRVVSLRISCFSTPLRALHIYGTVMESCISYSLPRSPRWLSRIMALNYTLRWLCDVVPVLSDHESDRYPIPQEVGQRLSSTASSPYSILITLLTCLISHSLRLPFNPPKQSDHVQYVASPQPREVRFFLASYQVYHIKNVRKRSTQMVL